jgi:hypothetical protein
VAATETNTKRTREAVSKYFEEASHTCARATSRSFGIRHPAKRVWPEGGTPRHRGIPHYMALSGLGCPYVGRLPIYAKTSHLCEDFPCMGRLPHFGNTPTMHSHNVGVLPQLGSTPTMWEYAHLIKMHVFWLLKWLPQALGVSNSDSM